MNTITICEKPSSMPFDAVHEVLVAAHKATPGISFPTTNLTEEELDRRLSNGGTVFVALDKNRVVGTITVCVEQKHKWYAQGTVARCRYVAVSPQYTRRHIASRIIDACVQWAADRNIRYLFWTTAYNNTAAIGTCEKNGFKVIDFFWFPGVDNPSVGMMRWLDEQPNDLRRRSYFIYRKIRVYVKRYLRV